MAFFFSFAACLVAAHQLNDMVEHRGIKVNMSGNRQEIFIFFGMKALNNKKTDMKT